MRVDRKRQKKEKIDEMNAAINETKVNESNSLSNRVLLEPN